MAPRRPLDTWAAITFATAAAESRLPSTIAGSSASNAAVRSTASGVRPLTRESAREYLKKWTIRS